MPQEPFGMEKERGVASPASDGGPKPDVLVGSRVSTTLQGGIEMKSKGWLIINVAGLEFSPPGFTTVTLAGPAVAISLDDTAAVNWFPLT